MAENNTKPIKSSNSKTIIKQIQKPNQKESNQKDKKQPSRLPSAQINYKTHDGHKLTIKEAKFIDNYIETGNQRKSVLEAGYKTVSPGQYGNELLKKPYIKSEIEYRLKQLEDAKIASAEEILQYFTGVMRGEIKDQFGLDAPLGERTRAAQELAKRKIDIVQKVNGQQQAKVEIALVWKDTDEEENNGNMVEDDESD